jgi:hypothetical protein
MSKVKEPHFFATDLGSYPFIKTLEDYTDLFAGSTSTHLRVGEASVYYLRSSTAIANIREFNPDAKIIAMFRNPVDMVYSLHSQLLYWSEETEPDFETAWRLQERRRQGLDLPSTCREPQLVQYAQMGQFGTQTERLLSIFSGDQVKLILFDDFAGSPQRVYEDVIDFLGVPRDNRTEFPRINDNKRARLSWLRDFIRRPPTGLRRAYHRVKETVGAERLGAIKKEILTLNTVTEKRPALAPALRAELVDTFRAEVALLSKILNRDLSHWR